MPEEQKLLSSYLARENVKSFVLSNLRQSLESIGFSKILIEDLTLNLSNIGKTRFDVAAFGKKHFDELDRVYARGFFKEIVPNYFKDHIVPETPSSLTVLDVGCGTGILAKLYSESGRFKRVIGIDINPYPEWDEFRRSGVKFEVVKESRFRDFLVQNHPDCLVITWTLHHMEYPEQERYMRYIHENLKPGSLVVILEDSYSTALRPESGVDRYNSFMEEKENDRKKIMSIYDWIANRVLAQRSKVPIPFGYRTLEEWEKLFSGIGFTTRSKKFIGFPDKRDINTPQSMIVISK